MVDLFVEIAGVDQRFPQHVFKILGSRHTPLCRDALYGPPRLGRDFDR
jgi:hypothetical protein